MENAITILRVQGKTITYKSKLGITKAKKLKGLNKNPYFLEGFLEEKVFVNINTLEVLSQEEKNNDLNSFSFEVEYEHEGRVNGFALTTKTVKAISYEKAIEKIYKSFKTIYEISEL